MYERPSASVMRDPEAPRMKSGVPPTALKARTGLSTPPGMTVWARANSFALVEGECLATIRRPRQRSRRLPRVVGDDDVGAGASDRRQRLHHDARLVEPSARGCRLEHRIFAAHLIGGRRIAER